MKRILITGAGSYVGVSFEKYIKENHADRYEVETVDMIDGSWKNKSFSGYDIVFHVAGIAHQKETESNRHLYYEVNRDLAVETAKKAKADGVSLFIFMSSMSVYGMDTGIITKDTAPLPKSNYGKSKLEAEEGIMSLRDGNFNVAVLRPPMIYGKNCRGNFQTVVKIVKKFPFFPDIKNQRSMIYIDNLSEAVVRIADGNSSGLFFPQNREKMNTTFMAAGIGAGIGKKIHKSKLLGLGVRMMMPFSGYVKKAFGSLIYDIDSDLYDTVDLENSIKRSMM